MVAIVDGHPDRRVVIGAAAAAGESGRLVHDDAIVGRGEPQRRGQSGKAGADDVNGAGHHNEIAQYDQKNFRPRQTHRRARRIKAACNQPVEDEPIGLPHDARRAHGAARLVRHDRAGGRKLADGQRHQDIAGLLQAADGRAPCADRC